MQTKRKFVRIAEEMPDLVNNGDGQEVASMDSHGGLGGRKRTAIEDANAPKPKKIKKEKGAVVKPIGHW